MNTINQTSNNQRASLPTESQLYLVSLGIGDIDNMTVKAQKTLAKADVVFGLRGMLEAYAPLLEGKEVHDAGHGLYGQLARRGDASEEDVLAHEQRNRQLIRDAVAAGKVVAIIDYGDSMMYSPQSNYLKEFRDLNPVVIPGISSFNAANAALGRSLTDGRQSQTVILTLAKNARDGYEGMDRLVDLAQTQSSMAFFTMGVDMAAVVEQLMQHYPADTPIAIVIHAGVADKQSIIEATLGTIVAQLDGESLPFQHMIYVGDFLSQG